MAYYLNTIIEDTFQNVPVIVQFVVLLTQLANTTYNNIYNYLVQ